MLARFLIDAGEEGDVRTNTDSPRSNPVKRDPVSRSATKSDVEFAATTRSNEYN